jgi:hypothetical protein
MHLPAMANWRTKYRFHEGLPCIDLHLKAIHNLFDSRDPAAYFERDIDADAFDYLVGLAEDLPPRQPFRIALWFAEPPSQAIPDTTIAQAFRTHIGFALLRAERRTIRQFRHTRTTFFVGLALLVASLFLREATKASASDPIGLAVREGILIVGWVAMWRPLESFFYDWLPYMQQRRLLRRMSAAPIDIHHVA